jgi:hypothetical protein
MKLGVDKVDNAVKKVCKSCMEWTEKNRRFLR